MSREAHASQCVDNVKTLYDPEDFHILNPAITRGVTLRRPGRSRLLAGLRPGPRRRVATGMTRPQGVSPVHLRERPDGELVSIEVKSAVADLVGRAESLCSGHAEVGKFSQRHRTDEVAAHCPRENVDRSTMIAVKPPAASRAAAAARPARLLRCPLAVRRSTECAAINIIRGVASGGAQLPVARPVVHAGRFGREIGRRHDARTWSSGSTDGNRPKHATLERIAGRPSRR
jgi:hypothetical protein